MKKAHIFTLAGLTLAGAFSAATSHADHSAIEITPSNHFDYRDIFSLEMAANPVVMPDNKHVVYERRSMDIMKDSMRRNLWMVSLDGSEHLPLLSDSNNHYSPVFSPDGRKMAYLSSAEGNTQIYLRDMASGLTARVTDVELSPSQLSFSPDGGQLAFVMFTPSPAKPVFSLPFKPKDAQWADEPHYIDQTLFQNDGRGMKKPGNTHLYVVPSIGGTPRQLTFGPHDFGGKLAWSKDGQQIIVSANLHAEFDVDILNQDLHAVDVASGAITTLTNSTGPEYNPALSPNGKQIAYIGFDDNGKSHQIEQLFVMNADGSQVVNLTPNLDRSVANIQWDKAGKGLYFSYDDHGKKQVGYVTLNGKITTLTDEVGGTTLGRPYTSGDFAVTDRGQVIYTHNHGNRPADLALAGKRSATLLTDLNGDVLDHKTLAKPELLTVKSSVDGRELQAWVVTPPNFDPTKKYPMILEIHGGPHTAYGPMFSAEVQLMAAAGYVVLYGNPRGSTSQGAEFANTIDKNYPSQDYNDLMDMVDGLLAKGYVDDQQLFVTGGSGGGVLTAWIIGNTDRFKAAVVAKPVINWISMIGTSDIYTFMARYWFTDLPWNDVDQYWKRSPLSLVGKVTTPTMVLTGELDVRTPMGESEQYYGALRLQGVESALVRIQGAYHGIAVKPSNLARKVGYILHWFDKYRPSASQE